MTEQKIKLKMIRMSEVQRRRLSGCGIRSFLMES